jgi:GT2 family glycosyltransferase
MSVLVIPCFIRSEWDRRCVGRLLESVGEQSVPFDRVFVVDDASPADFEVGPGAVERIRLDRNGGPARARNAGIARALGVGAEHILFTDHDCVLDRRWNEHMTAFLATTAFGAAGGRTHALGTTLLDRFHDLNGTLNGQWLLPDRRELWFMPSLNFGMKAAVARSFAFDERFPEAAGEDVDLCLRIRSRHRIGFCAKATLWHDFGYRSTLTGLPRFTRQIMKYKSANATLYDGHTVLLWDSSESIYEGNAHEPRT